MEDELKARIGKFVDRSDDTTEFRIISGEMTLSEAHNQTIQYKAEDTELDSNETVIITHQD